MTAPEPKPNGGKRMLEAIEERERRQRQWEEEGERSLWANLAMFGALGWLIVIPTLIGLFIGSWLDHKFGTNITLTAAGIVVGVTIGGYLAWKRMTKE